MLSDDDLVEAARLRRRRVLAAFEQGSAGREVPGRRTLQRLAAGLGVSALLAVGSGVAGLVQASLHDQAAATSHPAAAPAPRAGG